ncbi:hypothetical protein TNCV_1391741 [Trichonephila clavipes]|nr:hypothetical protein TNCV_1391741 [Trichonephila clavipes]
MWRSWFVVGHLYPRLLVRHRPKSVDFPDAQNRQRPCRMIIRHEKDPLSVRLAWMLSAKLNSERQISHRQSSGASLWERNRASKILAVIEPCARHQLRRQCSPLDRLRQSSRGGALLCPL